MVNYIANSQGSNSIRFPSTFNKGDSLTVNTTGTGRDGYLVQWTVPAEGKYRITASGAEGGNVSSSYASTAYPGKGATIIGDFNLNKDEIIKIIVGQKPNHEPSSGSAGGGGTFIYKGVVSGSGLLLVAGGGGGGGHNIGYGAGGSATESPNNASGGRGNGGSKGMGQGGNGGSISGGASGHSAAGGGTGWYSKGDNGQQSGTSAIGYGGILFAGGLGSRDCNGGFGGGGGAAGNGVAGGGGGGYSGGGGGNSWNGSITHGGGGGGGSFNKGDNQQNLAGVRSGNGIVMIEFIGSASKPPTTPGNILGIAENNIYLNGEAVEINWGASTDPEGDTISYEIEFTVNKSSWYSIMKDVTGTSKRFNITNKETDVAQFRVRAKDDKGVYSDYSYSAIFRTRHKAFLIQDNNVVKTFKDGVWKTI